MAHASFFRARPPRGQRRRRPHRCICHSSRRICIALSSPWSCSPSKGYAHSLWRQRDSKICPELLTGNGGFSLKIWIGTASSLIHSQSNRIDFFLTLHFQKSLSSSLCCPLESRFWCLWFRFCRDRFVPGIPCQPTPVESWRNQRSRHDRQAYQQRGIYFWSREPHLFHLHRWCGHPCEGTIRLSPSHCPCFVPRSKRHHVGSWNDWLHWIFPLWFKIRLDSKYNIWSKDKN